MREEGRIERFLRETKTDTVGGWFIVCWLAVHHVVLNYCKSPFIVEVLAILRHSAQ